MSSDESTIVDRLYVSWQRAEQRYREMPLGSPEAKEALAGVDQLWEAYEEELGKAIGRGTVRPPRSTT